MADPSLAGLRVLSPAEAGRIIGRSKTQMEAWRAQTKDGGRLVGPPFMVGTDGRTIGYPLIGLIDWIVRSTVWGSAEDVTMLALSGALDEAEALPWRTARRALAVLLPIADALGLPAWAAERELLERKGWMGPESIWDES